MTEKEVRDTFDDYGIWLNPDLEGEYKNYILDTCHRNKNYSSSLMVEK